MRYRLFAIFAATITFSGCTCTIDPESVAPPVACVAQGCAGKACGYDDCGHVCVQGTDPCEVTHSVRGGLSGGAGRVTSTHSVTGALSPASGRSSSTASDHSISQGTLSR